MTIWDDPRPLGDCDVIEEALAKRWQKPPQRLEIPERKPKPFLSQQTRPCSTCGEKTIIRVYHLQKKDYRCPQCRKNDYNRRRRERRAAAKR